MARRRIEGLRVLITGASQGIGKALAETAARRGARVLAAARSGPLLQELADRLRAEGNPIATVTADVASPDDRRRMVEMAMRQFGGLDILINNAGIGATGHFVEAGPERLRRIMEVNFFGLTETTPHFSALASPGKWAGHRQHFLHRRQARPAGCAASIRPASSPSRASAKRCGPNWPRTASM